MMNQFFLALECKSLSPSTTVMIITYKYMNCTYIYICICMNIHMKI